MGKLILEEQADPGTPAANKVALFAKSGGMLYKMSDDGVAELVLSAVLGAANLKMFVNAAGNALEWASGTFVGSFTRVLSVASGDVAYTGVGFKPSVLIGLGGVSGAGVFVGLGNASLDGAMNNPYLGSTFFYIQNTGAQTATIKTFDADGFTLTWTKVGSPIDTATVYYVALR